MDAGILVTLTSTKKKVTRTNVSGTISEYSSGLRELLQQRSNPGYMRRFRIAKAAAGNGAIRGLYAINCALNLTVQPLA